MFWRHVGETWAEACSGDAASAKLKLAVSQGVRRLCSGAKDVWLRCAYSLQFQ